MVGWPLLFSTSTKRTRVEVILYGCENFENRMSYLHKDRSENCRTFWWTISKPMPPVFFEIKIFCKSMSYLVEGVYNRCQNPKFVYQCCWFDGDIFFFIEKTVQTIHSYIKLKCETIQLKIKILMKCGIWSGLAIMF